MTSINSFNTLQQLTVHGTTYDYFNLKALQASGVLDLVKMPHVAQDFIRKLITI